MVAINFICTRSPLPAAINFALVEYPVERSLLKFLLAIPFATGTL